MNFVVKFGLFGLLLFLPNILIHVFTQKHFEVHTSGAILITGSSSGLGRDAALSLAHKGYLVLACVRKDSDKESLIQEAKTDNMHPIILDVVNQETIDKSRAYVTELLAKKKLPLIAVVNNAGIGGQHWPVDLAPQEFIQSIYNTNLFGVYRVMAAFTPLLRKTSGSRVVNIGSVNGLISTPYTSIYGGSKWALEAVTDSMRMELAPWNISVSLVEPAYVKTPISHKGTGDEDPFRTLPEEKLNLYKKHFTGWTAKRRGNFEHAPLPEVVTVAIEDAIISSTPRTRYIVASVKGVPAWLMVSLSRWMPDRLADILKLRAF